MSTWAEAPLATLAQRGLQAHGASSRPLCGLFMALGLGAVGWWVSAGFQPEAKRRQVRNSGTKSWPSPVTTQALTSRVVASVLNQGPYVILDPRAGQSSSEPCSAFRSRLPPPGSPLHLIRPLLPRAPQHWASLLHHSRWPSALRPAVSPCPRAPSLLPGP